MYDWLWCVAVVMACFAWAYAMTDQKMEDKMNNDSETQYLPVTAVAADDRDIGVLDVIPVSTALHEGYKPIGAYHLLLPGDFGKVRACFWRTISFEEGVLILGRTTEAEVDVHDLTSLTCTWMDKHGVMKMNLTVVER